jgi:protein-L-isoaspartate O-methyltransferase
MTARRSVFDADGVNLRSIVRRTGYLAARFPAASPASDMMAVAMLDIDDLARSAWDVLPERVVASRRGREAKATLRKARSRAIRIAGGEPPVEPTVITSVQEVDEMLAQCETAAAVSDDALRAVFARYRMEVDLELPRDPFSPEYRAAVFAQYEWLAGRPYSVANEHTALDLEHHLSAPFPYSTQSATTVADHLVAVGHLIRALHLEPQSRVLEFGTGWGNVTLALAQMGHSVTAIEIEAGFVELLRARASGARVPLEVINADFAIAAELEGRFDAVVFFESFHHCADHLALLGNLQRLVAPGGRIVFGAEPISKAMPVPWGLRLDGESLWAIRRNGWLELGFRRSYFLRALARTGWAAARAVDHHTAWGEVFVATRRERA